MDHAKMFRVSEQSHATAPAPRSQLQNLQPMRMGTACAANKFQTFDEVPLNTSMHQSEQSAHHRC
jgi:hypothetical protein